MPLGEMIESQERINGVEGVPITLAHVMALDELPAHHRDPFDRLLIAQARVEHAVLLSNDRVFSAYSVDVTW
jgi:PIN domain nuclease of toxin-antitoxin system